MRLAGIEFRNQSRKNNDPKRTKKLLARDVAVLQLCDWVLRLLALDHLPNACIRMNRGCVNRQVVPSLKIMKP